MPGKCSICHHPEREEIERALLSGASIREVGKRFNVSWQSVGRHQRDGHITSTLIQSKQAKEIAQADSLLSEISNLKKRGLKLLSQAEEEKDIRGACAALKECRGIFELLAKMCGELQAGRTVNNTQNVFNAPVFLEFQNTIMTALEPYPDARIAVSAALKEISFNDER